MSLEIQPLITVIVPCYNQSEFLEEALQSVVSQSYQNWECIVVDDGSTDDTESIASNWLARDERFIYIKKENGGLSTARNVGLNLAKGDWIQFLDSDDYIHPDKLESSINVVNSQEMVEIVVSNFGMFISNHKNASPAFCKLDQKNLTLEEILFGWDARFNIPIHCGFFKRSLFVEKLFVEKLKAKEDWVMWIKLFQNKKKAIYIDEVYALYRINPKSMTTDRFFVRQNLVEAYKYILKIIPSLYIEQFTTNMVDRFHDEITVLEQDISRLKGKKMYRLELYIKNFLKQKIIR